MNPHRCERRRASLEFPVYIALGPYQIHPHWLFETLAYLMGFRLYLWLRKQQPDAIADGNRMWAIVGATVGAALGSKVLYWFEQPMLTLANLGDPLYLMAGKSIVGGLLGGLIGVELIKRWVGERRSTGDLFVLPLTVGMILGRIGCFLTGLEDNTHGTATSLAWAVDFGDGIGRHPTQLYEILVLGLIALWAVRRGRQPYERGDLFKGFMILYLGFRLLVEFIKPAPAFYLGLTGIQVACLLGLLYYRKDLLRIFVRKEGTAHV